MVEQLIVKLTPFSSFFKSAAEGIYSTFKSILGVLAVLLGGILMSFFAATGNGTENYYPVGTGYVLSGSIDGGVSNVSVTPVSNSSFMPSIKNGVFKVAFDERYVLVERRAPKGHEYELYPFSSDAPYYILDTYDLILYGGLTKKEFKQKRDELSVPGELVLKKVYKYSTERLKIFSAAGDYYVEQTALNKWIIRSPAAEEYKDRIRGDMAEGVTAVAFDGRYIAVRTEGSDYCYAADTLKKRFYTILDISEDTRVDFNGEILTAFEREKGVKLVFREISDFPDGRTDLCDGYYVKKEAGSAGVYYSGSTAPPHIDSCVTEVSFDGRYILAKRNDLVRALPEEYKNDYQIPDEESYEYYILDTETDTLYGGFTEGEFEGKRKELGISKSLKLKSVENY